MMNIMIVMVWLLMTMILEGDTANTNDLNKVKDFFCACSRWWVLLPSDNRHKKDAQNLIDAHFGWIWKETRPDAFWCNPTPCWSVNHHSCHGDISLVLLAKSLENFSSTIMGLCVQANSKSRTLLYCDTSSILHLRLRPNSSEPAINCDLLFHSNVLS